MEFKNGEFELFRCIQSGMIVQREEKIKIWGFAERGEKLSLVFQGKTCEAITGTDGIFEFEIYTGKAGGPHTMTISSSGMSKTIEDIWFGDVYFINGQSNMELTIKDTLDIIGEEIDNISYPQIREFRVPIEVEFGSQRKQYNGGVWYKATKDNIRNMSAVGFHFAKNVHLNENVPVGLINTAVGGSPIEAHLPEEKLYPYQVYDGDISFCKNPSYVKDVQESEQEYMDGWFTALDKKDEGLVDGEAVYANMDLDDSTWKTIDIPGKFVDKDFEGYHGSVWLRHEFDIPEGCNLKGVLLRLGTIVDADITYINGVKIGKIDFCYPARRYPVPEGVLKHGRNVVCVRMFIFREVAKFVEGKRYCLQGISYIYEGGYTGEAAMPSDADYESGRWEINLAGKWKYKLGAYMPRMLGQTFFTNMPSGIYNAMIHPIIGTKFKGALWYQGETNTCNAPLYGGLLKTLINCYREWFGSELPFLCVQLPQYLDPVEIYPKDSWAWVRQQQRVVLDIPHAALCVTIDAGESNDLHPQTKDVVGYRLYLGAKALIYGGANEYMGPEVENVEIDNAEKCVLISFNHCEGGLVCTDIENENKACFNKGTGDKNGTCFELCIDAENDIWISADSVEKTDSNVLKINAKGLADKKIFGVRYCYGNAPQKPFIYNKAGLPASPFICR